MSFRRRLTLFFFGIVVIPMAAVAVVIFVLLEDADAERAAGRAAEAERVAVGEYWATRRRAAAVAEDFAADVPLASAIRERARERIADRLPVLVRQRRVDWAQVRVDGVGRVQAGRDAAVVAVSTTRLLDELDRSRGTIAVGVVTAAEYAEAASRLLGVPVVVTRGQGAPLASTLVGLEEPLPADGDVRVAGREYRVASFDDGDLRIHLLIDPADDDALVEFLIAGVGLAGFLLLAFAFALTVSSALRAESSRLLDAARRLGAGDLSTSVPVDGTDEFAALGSEFNRMARQLEARVDELQRERERLKQAIRRVGDSFATGLDRDAALGVLVQTAMDGVVAACGRATLRVEGGQLHRAAAAGSLGSHEAALRAAESSALDAGELVEAEVHGAVALAHPIRQESGERVLGVLAVSREGRNYGVDDRELMAYLAQQAAVSIENVDLHEAVRRQAVTDELTGLYNHRHFQEVMDAEVERTRRYGQHLGLIMLDLDDFKRINDTYGHMQGDSVLREVAAVLRDTTREIDEPARYGGEEMAVVLPQTDLEGTYLYAERVRRRIERLEIPLLAGTGRIRVTASLGAAALPGGAPGDKQTLVAAADAALYQAKREGKNRTVRAGAVAVERAR